tara:strand:- start:195 stop:353 length:159 start_codon:yes stop_codon:yes gene_type:complete
MVTFSNQSVSLCNRKSSHRLSVIASRFIKQNGVLADIEYKGGKNAVFHPLTA